MILRGLTTIGDRAVDQAHLTAGDMDVKVLSFGAITRGWEIAGRSVVLGYDDPAEYGVDPFYMGAIAGRVANRIAGGRFSLEGEAYALPLNNGPNHLHGGYEGLSRQHWEMEADTRANAVRLTHVSPDGTGGYPGRVAFEVIVRLTLTRLSYEMRAEVDRPTPVNLAQHNYYNLTGGPIWDHELTLAASTYLPVDETSIPTGAQASVAGTRFDFRRPRKLGAADPGHEGTDHCMVLDGDETAAELAAPDAPRLRLHTDQPGLQLYTGGFLEAPFARFGGVCLEPQGFPNAVNEPGFPSVVVHPGAPYTQTLSIEVA